MRQKRLTEIELRALRQADAGLKLRDDQGVFGIVRAGADGTISVYFMLRYRIEGRTREVHLGTWPKVSLAGIREERDRVVADKRSRVDPAERRLAERLKVRADIVENERRLAEEAERREAERLAEAARLEAERLDNLSVQDLYDAWVETGLKKRKDGGAEVRRTFGKDVLPVIGSKPVRAISEDDIRKVVGAVVERGSNRLAVLMLADLKQMFRWAEIRQPWRRLLVDGNPALLVAADSIASDGYEGNERTRVLSADELRALRDKLQAARDQYEAAPDRRKAPRPLDAATEAALWIMLATTCRVGEITRAQWVDVDLEAGTWLIPAKNSKNAKAHMVYLSGFAVGQLRVLRALDDKSVWVMPAKNKDGHVCPKSIGKQIADRQLQLKADEKGKPRQPMKNRTPMVDALVLAGGRWTAHDLRRSGATMMQAAGVTPLIVDRCLNHVEANTLRRVYMVHDYAQEKCAAWRLLGERIEAILSADNVVPIRGAA